MQSSGMTRGSVAQQDTPLDILAREFINEKALLWAVEDGRETVVRKMCDSGANIACFDDRRRSPLHLAAAKGHIGIVQLLLEKRVDINSKSDLNWTPAMAAVHKDHFAVVELIRAHAIAYFTKH